jgi:protein-L-isoaspartate(D-aspartate) O-methyltransferase
MVSAFSRTPSASAFDGLRAAMVTSQLRVSKVTDESVITAMGEVERHLFVPTSKAAMAYADQDVALGNGRYLVQPLVLARVLAAADIRPGQHVLVIGAGAGYSAAVLAQMGAHVTALEEDDDLRASAAHVLAIAGYPQVKVVAGKLTEGYAADAPYDVIFVDGGFEKLPETITSQLADNGVFAGIMLEGTVGRGVSGRKSGEHIGMMPFMDALVHGLPGFEKPKEFAF